MDDTKLPFSFGQLIKGLVVGVVLGGACLVVDVFFGAVLAGTHVMFLGAISTLILLGLVAAITIKKSRDTGFARGILIALAVAAIIASACGIAMGTGPLRFN